MDKCLIDAIINFLKDSRNQSIGKSLVLERLAGAGDRVGFITNRLGERTILGTPVRCAPLE